MYDQLGKCIWYEAQYQKGYHDWPRLLFGRSAPIALMWHEQTRGAVVSPKRDTEALISEVAARHGVTVGEIKGQSRVRHVLAARNEAIAAVKKARPTISLPRLGAIFGGRDHTTIKNTLDNMGVGTTPSLDGWRSVPSVPNYYANECGQIRFARSHFPRTLTKSATGYLGVSLCINGVRTFRSAHVMVCEAFHGPRPSGQQCRHLDGNPGNNLPSNLAWGTPSENAADRTLHGNTCHSERNGNAKLTFKAAENIRSMYAAGGINQYELAAMFGVSQAQINNIVLHKQMIVEPTLRHGAAE